MSNTLKSQCSVSPGTLIEGKWHRHQYVIIKQLGIGATGTVYLARHKNNYVALKMSDNGLSITSEVNVLKSFAKVQGSSLGPSLLDVDDWVTTKEKVSFYVMEYIKGPGLLTFIHQQGQSWTIVLILQLLSDLQRLHDNGWVFGDLKPENLIVTGPPPRIRCIDVGGTTLQGRAIKEYTEFFDRGYWGLGTRKADPTYDLFAVAMIMINLAYPKRFPRNEGGLDRLKKVMQQTDKLQPYEVVMIRAFQGELQSAKAMRQELLVCINRQSSRIQQSVYKQHTPVNNKSRYEQRNRKAGKQTTKAGYVETALILLAVSIFYAIYIYGQVM